MQGVAFPCRSWGVSLIGPGLSVCVVGVNLRGVVKRRNMAMIKKTMMLVVVVCGARGVVAFSVLLSLGALSSFRDRDRDRDRRGAARVLLFFFSCCPGVLPSVRRSVGPSGCRAVALALSLACVADLLMCCLIVVYRT